MLKSCFTMTLGVAIMLVSLSCEGRRSSSQEPKPSQAAAPLRVDDAGRVALTEPTVLEQRQGKALATKERASSGSYGARPGKSWLYEGKASAGFFLVAASSQPNIRGGDMLRRIDLGKQIGEFDYDETAEGKQGAFIYVSDAQRSVVPSRLIDGEGLFKGHICALVPGPDKTIIALAGHFEGGVAFVLNPYEKAQAFTPLQVISLPYAARPCRATYSEDNKKLYIIDVAHTSAKNGQEGLYVADIYNDGSASTASFYSFGHELKINAHSINNFQSIELYNDMLYLLSGNGRFDAEWESVIYSVPLNVAGEPIFEEIKHVRSHNPIYRIEGCGLSPSNLGALKVIDTKEGPRLVQTGTATLTAWSLGDELVKVDLNPARPGVQGHSLLDHGSGGTQIAFDPKGESFYVLPNCRSSQKKVKLFGSQEMLAFEISAFQNASLKPLDPMDAGYRSTLLSLKGASYLPQFPMVFSDFAVGPQHIAVIGAAESNISGLAAGGDVLLIDKAKRSPIAFNKAKDMRRAHELRYGFKLAEGDSRFEGAEQNSRAVIWVP